MEILDIHSHIICGVDDGSQNLEESGAMLSAAKAAGVSAIIATPHVYTPDVDFEKIKEAFVTVRREYADIGLELNLGCELNFRVLLDYDPDIIKPFCIYGTNVLLLEPPSRYLPESWENLVIGLQQLGVEVIIAHPERCVAFQNDISQVKRMLEIGCELQVSASSLLGKKFSRQTRKCAVELLKKGMIGYIASDAHCAKDYKVYAKALKQYGNYIVPGKLLK